MLSEDVIVKMLLSRLKKLGWRIGVNCPSGIVRGSPIIRSVFIERVRRLNERTLRIEGFRDEEIESIVEKAVSVLENSEPHDILEYLKGLEKKLVVREGRRVVGIELVDYGNLENNEFSVCTEVEFYGEHGNIRPDLILYVNGVPIVIIEVENPLRLGERAVEEGVAQLLRYEREYPWLFKYVQVGVVYTDEENSVYMPMLSYWRGEGRWYGRWRDEKGKYNIIDLLKRERVLDVIRWFIFYKGIDKKKKIVPRYNQYWATLEAINRTRAYIEARDVRNRGLIWHWQGSGKTYIMFYIAHRFFEEFKSYDPVVFFIVDRRELQRQLYEEFIKDLYAPHFQEYIKIIESIEGLKKILMEIRESELNRRVGVRGVYVVLIQKFRPDQFIDLEPIEKKEVLLLLDEAHRSQYGDLGATINKVLPNAVRFAFTGTPVMSYERNTFEYFAYPELRELYLHKYFISDSIYDGYTLPLKYQVVQETGTLKINVTPNEIKELLDTWARNVAEVGSIDDLVEEEGAVELTATRKEIKLRLDKIKVFLENPKRLRYIAEYIADRIREDTENFKFKALVVTASRLACVRMKKFLDEALVKQYGEEARKWSEVVMTYTSNDPPEIRNYLEELLGRWRGVGNYVVRDWEEANRLIQDSFKDKEDPRILIVTDMLITGFDYPRLKVMYLDKPLYEHRLLQAIARVNRPYKSENVIKEFGLVIDFIGLLEHVKDVIRKYELLDERTYKEIYEESIRPINSVMELLNALITDLKQSLQHGIEISNYKVELDLDQVLELIRKGLKEDLVQQLEIAASIIAFGYVRRDFTAIDLLDKIRLTRNLYSAIGAYPDKLKFRDYVVVLTKLYNLVMFKLRALRVPSSFWDELLKFIYEKTEMPELVVIKEFMMEPSMLKETLEKLESIDIYDPRAKYLALDVMLSIRGLHDLEPANPMHKYIYERLKQLEEEWAKRLDLSLIGDLKKLAYEFHNYLEKRAQIKLTDKIIYDIQEFLSKKYSIEAPKLKNLESTITSIIERYKSSEKTLSELYESDRKQIKLTLLRDLLKITRNIRDEIRDVKILADELVEYIERAILNEIFKH